MEHFRIASPFYSALLEDSIHITDAAIDALTRKILYVLGPIIRLSCLCMFATILSADPPIQYWSPLSLKVLRLLEELRQEG